MTDTKSYYKSLFDLYESNLNGHRSHPYHEIRSRAIQDFDTLAFPTRRDEDWKYTPVTKMLQPSYKEATTVAVNEELVNGFKVNGLETYQLVFINGNFSAEHSDLNGLPEGVVVQTMEEAIEDEAYKGFIEDYIHAESENVSGAFLALNAAFSKSGYFIYVPKNVVVEKPFHFNYIATANDDPFFYNPQLLVVAERSSQVSILETFNATADAGIYLGNVSSKFLLRENANVHHYKLQAEGAVAFQVNNTEIDQQRDSVYSNYSVDLGGSMVRNNLRTNLKSSGTNTNYYGVYLGTDKQHIDNQTYIDHAFPHCESNELYKGVLMDRARGVFNGKVMVRRDAQKTNAYQQNSSLVLSPNAIMDAKPQLEIYADDVRCSHGATIGQLDEESVFYLRSRGLNDEQARSLLKQAFLKEVLDNIPSEAILEAFHAAIVGKFGQE